MTSMIEGWRSAWNNPPALKNFTFILHQLSAYAAPATVNALRWSQLGAATRFSGLPKVGVTVGIDLYDAGSPCGNVHIRNKTAVGERMALAAEALAYSSTGR